MTIGKKFVLSGVVLMALTVVLGGVTLISLRQFEGAVTALANESLTGVSVCGKLESRLLEVRGDIWKHIALKSYTDMSTVESGVNQKLQLLSADLGELERANLSPEERELNGRIRPLLVRYGESWQVLLALSRAGNKDEAAATYTSTVTPLFTALKESVQAETEYNRQTGARNSSEASVAGARTRFLTGSILLSSTLIGTGLLWRIVRSANRTLREAVEGLLAGAEQVAASAAHIASASQSLARGATEQAAALQQTAATGEELTATVGKNAESARGAETMMNETQQQVKDANRSVEQMAHAMDEIAEASSRISAIMKLIDGVAFQTNVLSLNAAVEAARAGEAGLGFAIVADEVRTLAQRCAQASKDTETLVEESIAKASRGKARVDEVGTAIRTITQQSAGVRNLVGEVKAASEEQVRGIAQISRAVTQMEQVTEAAAASAEESAATAEEMSAQAQALTGIAQRLATMVGATVQV
jgi:methyl-accepting chemotaxis protein/methyl-accepting chemotaxis protein-1 (serine sensor receptor)